MKRIKMYFTKYSPSGIEWVDDWTHADLIIEHYVRRDPELEMRISQKPYVLCFYCSEESRTLPEYHAYYQRLIGGAKWVYSYLPLAEEGFQGNILRGPCGIDVNLFTPSPSKKLATKPITVVTTGYVAYTEGIDAMIAATQLSGRLVHVGPGLEAEFGYDVGKLPHVRRLWQISDLELIEQYRQAKYVSGLRRTEGFELPVLEGILCGARPICFDLPVYRHWFNEFAIFVPEVAPNQLADILAKIFLGPYRAVTQSEQEQVKQRFSWENVARLFWTPFTAVQNLN